MKRLRFIVLIMCIGLFTLSHFSLADGFLFTCDEGKIIKVNPINNWKMVVLQVNEEAYLLPQAIAASGIRYSDGEVTVWMKGERAFVQVNEEVVIDGCWLNPPVSAPYQFDLSYYDIPVLSKVNLDINPLNIQIQTAQNEEAFWVLDPTLIALYFSDFLEGEFIWVMKKVEADTGNVMVTVVQGGLYDDSLKATLTEVVLKLNQGGDWRVQEAYQAYWCRRGEHVEGFVSELCP